MTADERKQVENELRAEINLLLQRCADGRREYALSAPPEMAHALVREGDMFEAAIRIVNEGEEAMYGWLPSWRWSDEMERRLFAARTVF